MKIESQSLAAYLFSTGLGHQDKTHQEIWRSILKFPGESWSPNQGNGETENSILDPGRVLGRMFCVKLDRYLKRMLMRSKEKGRQLGIEIPISWILRIAPEERWTPGKILVWAEDKSGGNLDEDISEIKKFFPNLFKGLTKTTQRKESNREMTRLFSEMIAEFKSRKYIHISAPKFHKSWTKLVGEDMEKKKDAIKAKQQWSMSVDGYFEKMCEDASDVGDVIQSGGGHVLLLAPTNSEPEKIANKLLRSLRKQFIDTDKRGWSPILWASWDPDDGGDGFLQLEEKNDVKVDKLIADLCDKYRDSEEDRYRIKEKWSVFKYGEESKSKVLKGKPAIIYLDVIGLGDHCWPKNTEGKGENKLLESRPPIRKRNEAQRGFIRSRSITAVIESTFGLIFAKHLPESVLAMGGDEIIMKMDSSEWLSVVSNVEEHCKRLHATIFREDVRLLWWAMCSEGDGVPDSDIIKQLKNQYRKLTVKERVSLMRFVNPMWTNIGGAEGSDRSPRKREGGTIIADAYREYKGSLDDANPGEYDLEGKKWVDWLKDLTAEVLANDMYDTQKVAYFDAEHRIEASHGAYQGSGAKSSAQIWSMILADLQSWIDEELSKMNDQEKGRVRSVRGSGWRDLLEESTQLVWKRTDFSNRMSTAMERKIKTIGTIKLVKKYGMNSADFKEWSGSNP